MAPTTGCALAVDRLGLAVDFGSSLWITVGISSIGVDAEAETLHDVQRPKQAATAILDLQLEGLTAREQEPESMERLAEGTPANQAGSSEPAGQPEARGSAPSKRQGSSTGDAEQQGRRRVASPGGRRPTERTAGCGRSHRRTAPSGGAASGTGIEPDPDGGQVRAGAGSQRQRNAGRVTRVNASEPSETRIRVRVGYGTTPRSTAASAGMMRSVGRRNRSPEKLTGESREAARGSVAPVHMQPMPVQSRRWPYISARASGGGHD